MKNDITYALLNNIVKAQDKTEKRINVLDYALMNEDGHTYFLQKILQHTRNGKQVFIESFLNRILDNDEFIDEMYEIRSQVVLPNNRRLDLLIESDHRYIVIENKVKLATDGDRQMDDYWEHAYEKAHDKARLIYLTLAGGVPAKWSIDEEKRKVILEKGVYSEKSYRNDIVAWLKEDVLPNCLVSETFLSQSIRLYIDSISRLSGEYERQDLAERIYSVLNGAGISTYKDVVEVHQALNRSLEKMKSDDVNWVIYKEAFDLIGIVRSWLIRKCVYLSDWDTAYNLKWLLKNNPTLEYKQYGKFDVGIFKSIGQFSYKGSNYVQLATKTLDEINSNVRIHICCTPEGIKDGPYVFNEILRFISIEKLKKMGFVEHENAYRLPIVGFDFNKTHLADVARFVEKMACELSKDIKIV